MSFSRNYDYPADGGTLPTFFVTATTGPSIGDDFFVDWSFFNNDFGYFDPSEGGDYTGDGDDGGSRFGGPGNLLGSPLLKYDDAMAGSNLQGGGAQIGGVKHDPLAGFTGGWIPTNAMRQQDFVSNLMSDRQNLDVNSFQYNTWKGNNGLTYQIPQIAIDPATGEESTDIEDRIISLYNSFAQAEEAEFVLGKFGPDALQDFLQLDSLSELREYRQNATYIPQVVNQSNETISLDGSTITFADGTAFNTNLDGNFTGGVGTSYNDFYLSFINDQVANFKAGNDWDITSIGYGYDDEGYDDDGYNVDGYNRDGFNVDGINVDGYNTEGYDRDGYNIAGYDRENRDPEGYDVDGYDIAGYDRENRDVEGYDVDGYDSVGIDRDGYNLAGYDSDGFDRQNVGSDGFNRDGVDGEGYDRDGYDPEGVDRDGYGLDGYNVTTGFDVDGFNVDGFNADGIDVYGNPKAEIRDTSGLSDVDIADGYYYDEDGILVIPPLTVVGTSPGDGNNNGVGDGDGFGNVGDPGLPIDVIGDGSGDGSGNLDGSGPDIVTKPETGIRTAEEEAEYQARVDEIMGRFSGSRRNYNDFLRSDEGKTAAKNLGDWVNKNLSPSGEFDISQKDALLDKILSITTGGQFDGLNAFALGVNLLEGIIDTDLIDVPNVGFFINNLVDEHISDKLLSDIEKVVPDFLENITGLSAILQDQNDPAGGYLAQGFDFSAWLLGDLDMARAVDYGLRPATEQIAQQQLDLATEIFGEEAANEIYNDPATTDANFFEQIVNILGDAVFGTELDQYLDDIKSVVSQEEYDEIKARVDEQPSLFSKLSELVTSGYDYLAAPFSAMGNIMESIGFNQQYYLGGTLQTNLVNLLGASSLGLPVGSIANMLGDAMAPSGQDLSDYLWANGIDPTTATRSDIGRFLVDQEYDVPGFNYETGEFEVQTDADGNEFNTDTDGDGFFDSFINNVSSLVGDQTVAGGITGSVNDGITGDGGIIDTVVDSGKKVAGGAGNKVINIFDGATLGGIQNGNGADGGTVPLIFDVGNGSGNGELDGSGFDAYGNPIVADDGSGNDGSGNDGSGNDGSGNGDVDGNGIITGTGNMGDIDESAYDAAYETAKFIIGASEAERFRGVGLRDEELQQIIGDYSSMVGESEAKRLLELNRIEQTGINELRDIQKGSDLDLLGSYGQEYADAVRGLDPTALGVLGQQEELSNRLYRRAAGDLTSEEEADAEERAFEIASQSGRTLDSTRIANVIRAEEDTIANLEGRAQQAGTSTYNMSRGLTGNIPAMLLGNAGNPYGTGVGQVTPPLGVGDLVSMGTSQYAQQQNIAQAQAQLASVQQNYDAAIAANEPSKAEEFLQDINEITSYISLAGQGLEFLGNAPQAIRNTGNSIRNAWNGMTTLLGGGSSNYAYDPTSSFNITGNTFNADDYLNTTSFGTSGGFDFGNY